MSPGSPDAWPPRRDAATWEPSSTDGHQRGRRAVSTVLDAALFMLLVAAAIGLLYAVPDGGDAGGSDRTVAPATATTLATSIQTVEYAPGPAGDRGPERDARGTTAELLATATVAEARLDGDRLVAAPNYTAAVREAATATLGRLGHDLEGQFRTRWTAMEGADLEGGLVVGPAPPADADVHAATLDVPLGTRSETGPGATGWASGALENDSVGSPDTVGRSMRDIAHDDGCEGVATAVARRVVGTLYPPQQGRTALLAGEDPAERTGERYERAADAVFTGGQSLPASVTDGEPGSGAERVREANALLEDGLADHVESTACSSISGPKAAAAAARPQVVTVTVRVWSP